MKAGRTSFAEYLLLRENKTYSFAALILGTGYFFLLRYLYPVPSFFADSFTFVGAAITNQPITFRPILYSKILQIFKFITTSDVALIAAQFFCNLLVNLFLFFTTSWFFRFKKAYKILLFALLIVHPFYLFYSNYVSSDAFFNSFAVLWFTLILWILIKPKWYLVLAQLVLLGLLFELRYNAIYFPVIAAVAILLSNMKLKAKLVSITANVLVVAGLMLFTSYITGKVAGTKTFSPFGGWQMANNALHVLRHEKIDTATIDDKQVRELITYSQNFFDTTKEYIPGKATAWYMWYFKSPLKTYMQVYPKKSKAYFRTWAALGPIYNKFGRTIILKKPGTYIQYFVLPNSVEYFLPELEIYQTYMENKDTIAPVAVKYFKYKTNEAPKHKPAVYAAVFTHWKYVFLVQNILFITLGLWYWIAKKYKHQPRKANQFLLCFALFFLANMFFIILLAPSVLRYHIFIMVLAFPVLLFLIRALFGKNIMEEDSHENIFS